MTLKGNVQLHWRPNADGGRTYYVRYRHEGDAKDVIERVGRTGPDPGKREINRLILQARNLANERQAELRAPDPVNEQRRSIPFTYAADLYSQWLRGDQAHQPVVAQCTADARDRVIASFFGFVGTRWDKIREVWKISHQHLANWRYERMGQLAGSSLLTECSHLQNFLDFCFDQGWMPQKIAVIPREDRKRLRVPRQQPDLPSDDVVKGIIGALAGQRADVALCLAATGLRQGELRGLRVQDWDNPVKLLSIRQSGVYRTKWHGRSLPIGPALAARLSACGADRYGELPLFARQGERPLGQSEINSWLRPFNVTPHDFRRWFRTTMLDMGLPEPYAKCLMGHALSAVDLAYVGKFSPEKARPWMERLEGLLAGVETGVQPEAGLPRPA